MKMLNIGCGTTSHPKWVNIDMGVGSDIISHDVRNGLPFPDKMFGVVYHSHLLEHLPIANALPFMEECFRVLKPGGMVRVIVPDLEQIARLYLEKLATARESEADYNWIMFELYDQFIRQESGGNMERYLRSSYSGLSQFIVARMGGSAALYGGHPKINPSRIKPSWRTFVRVMYRLRLSFAKLIVHAITGAHGRDAFMEGVFRNSGEIHHWMYDSFSLGKLMANAGFVEIRVLSPTESRIPDFSCYELDVSGGVVRKPDSLVMEGVRR